MWDDEHVLFHSIDGGKSWDTVQSPAEDCSPLKVYFTSPQTGWLLANGGMFVEQLFRTTDGGQTWLELK